MKNEFNADNVPPLRYASTISPDFGRKPHRARVQLPKLTANPDAPRSRQYAENNSNHAYRSRLNNPTRAFSAGTPTSSAKKFSSCCFSFLFETAAAANRFLFTTPRTSKSASHVSAQSHARARGDSTAPPRTNVRSNGTVRASWIPCRRRRRRTRAWATANRARPGPTSTEPRPLGTTPRRGARASSSRGRTSCAIDSRSTRACVIT